MKAPHRNQVILLFSRPYRTGGNPRPPTSAASAISKINSLGPGVSRPLTSAEHQSASAKRRPASADRALHAQQSPRATQESFVQAALRRGNDGRADEDRGRRGREAAQ